MLIKDKDESLCYVEDATPEEKRILTKELSFFYPNYQFLPSFRAGITDGKKRFYKLFENKIIFPKGLVYLLAKAVHNEGIKVKYDKITYTDVLPTMEEFNEFVKSLNIPFEPYDYQLTAAFESITKYRQVNLMATGSGKSLTIYLIIRWMLKNKLKSVIVVPTVMLTTQMFQDFVDYGWSDAEQYVRLIGGENKIKTFDKEVTLSTWQSLYNSPTLFGGVDCIISDESHTVKAETFETIIFPAATNARYRLGFTGTLPSEAIHKITILSCLGQAKRYITTRQLIDRGLATPVIIKALFFNYPMDERQHVKTLKYQGEIKYVSEHTRRNTVLSKIINKISSSGNSIVLFDRKEHGKELCLQTFRAKFGHDIDIKELMKPDNPYGIFYLVGESKSSDREKIRQLLEEGDKNVLFGTSSILSTGINIKNLHDLFLVSGGKSSIKLNQSIGRLLRLHASKNTVTIWDIIDDFSVISSNSTKKNYFYKHFEERLEQYLENGYEIIEKVIKV